MRFKIFYEKNVHENAGYYYQLAKETKEKIEGIKRAINDTLEELESIAEQKQTTKKNVRIKRQKEWFEKFHYIISAGGKLILAGRNAQQNDLLVAKHMDFGDLFFHADIQGGAVVILKNGIGAEEQEMKEAAQIAASFSNAWRNANATVDVYAVKKNQLSKKVTGGFIPVGAFAITGERKWFKSTKLGLKIGLSDNKDKNGNKVQIAAELSKTKFRQEFLLIPSSAGKEKGAIAKSLAKRFGVHSDELLEILPNGKILGKILA